MIDLKGGPCIYKRISGCGSGTEYMAVTPWGDLYPCHQFVGEEKFKLGNVFDGISNFEAQEDFAACNVFVIYTMPKAVIHITAVRMGEAFTIKANTVTMVAMEEMQLGSAWVIICRRVSMSEV